MGISMVAVAMDAPGSCREESERFLSRGGGCLDLDTGLAWAMPPRRKMNFKEATDYCAGLDQGGKKGWRLPTRRALTELAKNRKPETFSFSIREFFWAEDSGNSADAWTVNLESGEPSYESKETFGGGALCVRNEFGCRKESDRFKTRLSGCHDNRNSRVWSAIAPNKMSWPDASRHCRLLEQGRKREGWRLPTRREIMDVAGPMEAAVHFVSPPAEGVWATPHEAGPSGVNQFMPEASLTTSAYNISPAATGVYHYTVGKPVICIYQGGN